MIAACARFTSSQGLFGHQTGQIDTLVLGCTHYPFAKPHLQELLGPTVQIMDNGVAVARQTRRILSARLGSADSFAGSTGQVSLFTTGQPDTLQAAAARWLSLDVGVNSLYFL